MASSAAGLQSHIWNNNLRSVLMLVAYPFLLAAMVWAIAYVVGYQGSPSRAGAFAHSIVLGYWPLIVAGVGVWFCISYFFHTNMIGSMVKAHPVTRKEEPELYNLLENLCIAEGMTMPALQIIETHARNAFASGINEKSYTVTVTRGLMNSLTKSELEAVLAHELTHILNRDVRLLMVCVVFTGMVGLAAQLVWHNLRYNYLFTGHRRNRGGGILVLMGIGLILWVGYMATVIMRFALSRRREYMADAGAVRMTRNPEAMMTALMRIAGRDRIPGAGDDIAMMCIENHVPFMGVFATHPPIDSRIQAISSVTRTPVPVLPHAGPAKREDRFGTGGGKHIKNPWLTRTRGPRR